jgi:hypothetical protein
MGGARPSPRSIRTDGRNWVIRQRPAGRAESGGQSRGRVDLIGPRAVRPRERINSPLENRKVRLRGLGGRAACGVAGTCASATESSDQMRGQSPPARTRELAAGWWCIGARIGGSIPQSAPGTWPAYATERQSTEVDFVCLLRRIHSLCRARGESLLCTPALPHSRTPALPHSRTPALTHSRTHALTHSRTPALTHSRTHALPSVYPAIVRFPPVRFRARRALER